MMKSFQIRSVCCKLLLPVLALLLVAPTSDAGGPYKETFLINGQQYTLTRKESVSTNGVKSVDCTGTFSIRPGQTLVTTTLCYVINAGTATAQGTVNNAAKTYTDGVGDPELKQYYLRFTIQQGTSKFSYNSPTYTFGKQ